MPNASFVQKFRVRLILIILYWLGIALTLGGASGLQADWINLTGAETAPNIAEIYVLDDHVKVVLEVYIGYLRKKTQAGGEPRLIHTIRGVGYVLREE